MSDQGPGMPRANPPFWIGLSLGCALFLAVFIAWAAIFGIGGGPSPNQQEASGAPANKTRGGQTPRTTGQGPATQPAQQQQQK